MKYALKFVFPLIHLLSISLYSQLSMTPVFHENGKQGIIFFRDLSWKKIKEKAMTENKFIFMDCYTTWCGPCREMEAKVYNLDSVGEIFNSQFICIKMQMDSTKKDSDTIQKEYSDVHEIMEEFKITSYPTFLFFTPDGRIVNRSIGTKSPSEFISMAKETLDPSKNYYSLLDRFEKGQRNLSEMSFIARRGLILNDSVSSKIVAKAYLLSLDNKATLTKDNIGFMYEFTESSLDPGFKWFYLYADSINKVMDDDTYSQGIVQRIIYKEIVLPAILQNKSGGNKEPDWQFIHSDILAKYNMYYANRVVTAARSTWGLDHNKFDLYTKYLVIFEDSFGSKSNHDAMASLVLNNYAWAIFLYSNKSEELNRALTWSTRATMMYPNPNWMDTYANILYKLGRITESIMWEDIASRLSPEDSNIKRNLELMKKMLPTWTIESKEN